jgi:hypothetical protein
LENRNFLYYGGTVVMSYGMEVGVRFTANARNSPLLHSIQTGSENHQAPSPVETVGSFDRVKRPWRESEHSSSVEANNVGIITPFHGMSSWHSA